jgi:hypothetical protein
MKTLTTQHIGAYGQLLVQAQLLRLGIDSARMTSDSGIDLLAYDPDNGISFSVQVKTREPEKAGKGKRESRPSFGIGELKAGKADIFAFFAHGLRDTGQVRVIVESCWYLTKWELRDPKICSQRDGEFQFFVYSDTHSTRHRKGITESEAMKFSNEKGIERFLEILKKRIE